MTPALSDRAVAFHDWLKSVIEDGEAILQAPPSSWMRNQRATLLTIAGFAKVESLDLAGPNLDLDEEAGLWAAEYLAGACWELVSGEVDAPLANRKSPAPKSPAVLFSVDLFFRYLPKVLGRAQAAHFDGPLPKRLQEMLQRWPLSGVLAPGKAKPEGNLDFFGHIGLQQLYAERFLVDPYPAWLPREGATREWIETIFAERGVPLPLIPESTSPETHE